MTLGADNAPGQEVRQDTGALGNILHGPMLEGVPVDFSHGDVDAFPPIPGTREAWDRGFAIGGQQAYSEYRGHQDIRESVARRLADFTAAPICADNELIITPGTQGALFLAMGAVVDQGTKVAVVEPDYFANRKLVHFFNGEVVPIPLNFRENTPLCGPDLDRLDQAFQSGVKVLVFSTPNNPTGLIYSPDTIETIAKLASHHGVTVIADQLYSRLIYAGERFSHLRANRNRPENLITIMGPSKTESLSGFRLGVAFGSPALIDRMEKLQAIVSLRAAGYNQAALASWLDEPQDWLSDRIRAHQAIRDDLLQVFRDAGLETITPQGGSYIFPKLPVLKHDVDVFVRLLRHQAKVTVTPGTEFGPTTPQNIRLNFSQDHAAAVAAAGRIIDMTDRYRG